jgi:hypothetical protein
MRMAFQTSCIFAVPLSFLSTTLRSIQAYQRLMKAVNNTQMMAICSNEFSP